jgi:lipopolysaccharide biosynthesis regulator YciM
VLTANQETGDAWTLGSCLCTLADVQVLQGEIDAAFTTARQVLAMSGVNENARIHAAAECSLALAYLVSGELEAAQRVIDQKPLADLGLEVGLKRLMVTGLVALARGEAAAAVTTAQTVIERARKNDYQLFAAMADRLLKAVGNPPPRTELPWLLYGAAPQTV